MLKESTPVLRPLGLLASLLWMGIPGVILLLAIRVGVPIAIEAGYSLLAAFQWALYGPLGLLILVTLIAYRRDGYPLAWPAFRDRLRLTPLTRRSWLITIGATLFVLIAEGALEPLGHWLAQVPPFQPPDWLTAPFNPNQEFIIPPSSFLGTELAGAWWVPLVYIPCLLANILGEELLWRGYMLPRQELVFGRWAWLVNGAFWIILIHMFMPWVYLNVIPTMIVVPLVTQYLRSTWAAIVIHGTGNCLLLILLILGVVS